MRRRITVALWLLGLLPAPLVGQTATEPPAGAANGAPDPLAALAQWPAAPARERGVRLSIRDADGKPCPTALVVLVPAEVEPRRVPRDVDEAWAHDPLRMTAARLGPGGRRLPLDAQGTALLDPAFAGTVLAIGDGSAVGWTRPLHAERTPQTLTLARVQTLAVAVTGSDGAPAAGVPVLAEDPRAGIATVRTNTGADGTARLAILSLDGSPVPAVAVRLLVAAEPALAKKGRPGDAPLRFTLPVCGSVHASWSHAEGLVGLRAQLSKPVPTSRYDGTALSTSLLLGGTWNPFAVPQSSAADRAQFAFVQPGMALELALSFDGLASPLRFAVPPVESGKATALAVDLQQGPPWVHGRVLGADGKPLADVELDVWRVQGTARSRLRATTDAAGRLALPIADEGEATIRLEQRQGAINGEVLASGEWHPPRPQPGPNALDDLRLVPEPIALRGRILDPDHRPLPGLRLSLLHGDSVRASSASAADGSFELRLPEPHPPQLKLSLPSDSGCSFADLGPQDKLSVPSGNQDVVIRVQRAGRVLLGLVPPLPANLAGLTVQLTDPDHHETRYSRSIAPDRSHVELPAGRWQLELLFYRTRVLAIDDVTIEPGIENHVPQLMTIDWPAFAQLVQITIEGPDGMPTDDCTITGYSAKHEFGALALPRGGRAALLVPKGSNAIGVRPRDPELTPVDLTDVDGDRTVRLMALHRVALSWTEPPKLPNGATLIATTRIHGKAGKLVTFAADGTATMFANPGDPVELRLGIRGAGRVRYFDPSVPFTVPAADGPPSLRLRMPAELKQALEAGQ